MALQLVAHVRIKSGECIKVKGKVPPEAQSFALNLGQDESNLILHFNPRFDFHGDIRTIVCNSKTDGEWGTELRETEFPFQQGEDTKISVSFDAEKITVELSDGQEVRFPNRFSLEAVDYLSITGDLHVRSIKFK